MVEGIVNSVVSGGPARRHPGARRPHRHDARRRRARPAARPRRRGPLPRPHRGGHRRAGRARRGRPPGLQPGAGDDLVRAQSWKIVCDGSNQGYSGYQSSPYLGTDACGHPNYADDDLTERIAHAHGEGWQLMVHANGDAARRAGRQRLRAGPRRHRPRRPRPPPPHRALLAAERRRARPHGRHRHLAVVPHEPRVLLGPGLPRRDPRRREGRPPRPRGLGPAPRACGPRSTATTPSRRSTRCAACRPRSPAACATGARC